MSAGCPHGMPSPFACVSCMEDGPLPVPKLQRDGWPFSAVFDGTCGGCHAGIIVGANIVRMSDGNYRHVGDCERNTAR